MPLSLFTAPLLPDIFRRLPISRPSLRPTLLPPPGGGLPSPPTPTDRLLALLSAGRMMERGSPFGLVMMGLDPGPATAENDEGGGDGEGDIELMRVL